MKIFADENMPLLEELFGGPAELLRGPGRGLNKKDLAGVQVLLVRSVTKVNAELLAGTKVQFVGSATAGIDHVDQEYLQKAGIGFGYAPGCNANSVAEYVVAALLRLAVRDGFKLAGKRVGIVGHGEVGSRVATKCGALGMATLINDPPLAQQDVKLGFVQLDNLLDVDVLTLHVPLTVGGRYPTVNLIDKEWLERIGRPGMMLLNTSRGGVVNEQALWQAQSTGLVEQVVLDVYEAEKRAERVCLEALKQADIATPHIAGYSYDAKVAGALMLYEALAKRYGWAELGKIEALSAEPRELDGPSAEAGYLEQLNCAVGQAYDIQRDHEKLQEALGLQGAQRGAYFDGLRKNYPLRREFRNYRVSVERGYSTEAGATLKELGFSG